jgi:ATP-binding cassette subfamily B protein
MPKLFTRADSTTSKKTLRIFKEEIFKEKRRFWAYATLIPLNRLLYMVILPLLFSLVLQSLVSHQHNWQQPLMLLGIALIVSILSLITADKGFRLLFNHEEHMSSTLNERAMSALLAHSDQFFADRHSGSLAGDVTKFSGSIVNFLDTIFLSASSIVVNFVFSLIIIAFLSPILLLPLGLLTGLLIWRSVIGSATRGPIRHQRKLLVTKLNGTIADIIGNQQIVRFFATQSQEVKRVGNDRRAIQDIAIHEIDILQKESINRQMILFSFQILTLVICVWLYTTGLVSIGALIFAITYLSRLTSSLFDLSPLIRSTEQVFLDAANITDILDMQPDVIDTQKAHDLQVTTGTVSFNNVNFAYNDSSDASVVHDLSLVIPGGQRVGLVGHSGGGKTTLSKLVLRFADVTSGEITIDNQNISSVTQHSLHSQIAYVPQEPYLFHRSLRDNIAYGRPHASDNEIKIAAKRANAEEFITDLPQGLDTTVGERGVKLSGGQRQRIAIARAILKDAPILILDEATSALDSESEKLIQDALTKLMKNRTSIVIAHRLSTIAKLDRIIVLDKGRIIEDGTHAELLAVNGVYAKLWAHQSGGFIEE